MRSSPDAPTVTREAPAFGPGGERIDPFELRAAPNVRARLSSYGASLISLETPDAQGDAGEVALGFDDPARYLGAQPFFGCTVGRYANRIAGAAFVLDGRRHELTRNEGANHLHGGHVGLHRACFDAEPFTEPGAAGVAFRTVDPDGHEGYPGRLEVEVRYTLRNGGVLRIEYRARVDRPSVLSLTHHSYFNLRDGGRSNVLDHEVMVRAGSALAIDAQGLPTGQLLAVEGTPLDLRVPRPLRTGVSQLTERGGYDHCFVVEGSGLRTCATVFEPSTGRTLEVRSTQPTLQLYTGNFLDGSLVGHGGRSYGPFSGLCLETQHAPDAPNQASFVSPRIDPERPYAHAVEYRFGVRSR